MKDVFFLFLSMYVLVLIFGAAAAVLRFWVDVKKFHPKEEKLQTKKQFLKELDELAEVSSDADQSEEEERGEDDNGRDEHSSSVVPSVWM